MTKTERRLEVLAAIRSLAKDGHLINSGSLGRPKEGFRLQVSWKPAELENKPK